MAHSRKSERTKRKRHFSVLRLSGRGRRLVIQMLLKNGTYVATAQALRRKTGEVASPSALQRFFKSPYGLSAITAKPPDLPYGAELVKLGRQVLRVLGEIKDEIRKTQKFQNKRN